MYKYISWLLGSSAIILACLTIYALWMGEQLHIGREIRRGVVGIAYISRWSRWFSRGVFQPSRRRILIGSSLLAWGALLTGIPHYMIGQGYIIVGSVGALFWFRRTLWYRISMLLLAVISLGIAAHFPAPRELWSSLIGFVWLGAAFALSGRSTWYYLATICTSWAIVLWSIWVLIQTPDFVLAWTFLILNSWFAYGELCALLRVYRWE